MGPQHGAQLGLNGAGKGNASAEVAEGKAGPMRGDRVELSDHARFMDSLRRMPPVRMDRVEAARAAILDGTYEQPEVLDIAVTRLLEDLGL